MGGHAQGWELVAWLLPVALAFAVSAWSVRPARVRAVAETERICHAMAEAAMADTDDQEACSR